MFDWIPVELYTNIQYQFLLVTIFFVLINAMFFDVRDQNSISIFNYGGLFFALLFVLYMGLRPISGRYFVDMATYAKYYQQLQNGADVIIEKDYMFNYFMKFCSRIMNANSFFLVIAVLYNISSFLFSKKYFGQYWFFAFVMFIGSFSYWAYGVNGMRNGLGTSLFLFGLISYDKKLCMYIFFVLAYYMHASLIIPIAAFLVSSLYKNPKIFVIIWLVAIPLSLVGGRAWETFFHSLGIAEDRTQGYLDASQDTLSQFSKTGFRWDFLVYSASAVFAGWYFIFVKKVNDKFYVHLFGTYCIANAFWILVITAAFSNRFAYLSWFLMPVIIAYPMFRYKIWDNQYRVFGIVLFLYFMFTYVMNIVL